MIFFEIWYLVALVLFIMGNVWARDRGLKNLCIPSKEEKQKMVDTIDVDTELYRLLKDSDPMWVRLTVHLADVGPGTLLLVDKTIHKGGSLHGRFNSHVCQPHRV